jgi:hypothetical protein
MISEATLTRQEDMEPSDIANAKKAIGGHDNVSQDYVKRYTPRQRSNITLHWCSRPLIIFSPFEGFICSFFFFFFFSSYSHLFACKHRAFKTPECLFPFPPPPVRLSRVARFHDQYEPIAPDGADVSIGLGGHGGLDAAPEHDHESDFRCGAGGRFLSVQATKTLGFSFSFSCASFLKKFGPVRVDKKGPQPEAGNSPPPIPPLSPPLSSPSLPPSF